MKIKSIYFLWLLYGKSHLNAHGFWCIEKDWFQYASACAWDITDYLSNLDRFTCNFPFHRSLYVECAKESVIFYYVGISGPLPRNPVSCMVYLYISSELVALLCKTCVNWYCRMWQENGNGVLRLSNRWPKKYIICQVFSYRSSVALKCIGYWVYGS